MKTVGGIVAGLVIGAAVGATAFPRRETVTVTHTVTQTVAPPVAPSEVPTMRDSGFTWKEAGKTNIVVIGAGPAGATFVKALAAMPGVRDKVTVTAIEQNEVWISGPPHVDFVIGIQKGGRGHG
ncbi:MAG: hypothetical protein ACO2PN_10850 [Pyrobaculum sp.]